MSAFSLSAGGLRTSIVVNGCEAVHYGTEINPPQTRASSWIVSGGENVPFSIYASLENLREDDSYVIRVYLDDAQVGKTIIRPGRPRGLYFSSVRISDMETRQFMFGRLRLSDEEAMRQPPWTEATGTIRITLTRALEISESRATFHAYSIQPPESNGSNGSYHCIQYARSQTEPERRDAKYFRVKGEVLLATHSIKYRPLSMLQKHGIVPYPPVQADPYSTHPPRLAMPPPSAPDPSTHYDYQEPVSPSAHLLPPKKRKAEEERHHTEAGVETEQATESSMPRSPEGPPEKKIKQNDD